MIQRIQSLYLLFVVLAGLTLVYGLNTMSLGLIFEANTRLLLLAESVFSTLLALGTIFLYKNRQNQFVANRIHLMIQLFLLGFFVYRSLNLSGGEESPEKGVGMLIPIFSIVFLVLANKAIKKDEDLVKSADRIR